MKKNIVLFVAIVLIAVGGIGAFIWAYSEMTHYRDSSEEIAYQAAEEAKKEQYMADEEAFAEKMKQPYLEFVGPADYGSISFNYPRTWSAYNIQNDSKNYETVFFPGVIPPIDSDTAVALRIQIINSEYEDSLSVYDSKVKNGELSASPITINQDQKGVLFDGSLNDSFKSYFVILKLRDKTLLVQTDTDKYIDDFDDIVLESFTFVP